MPSRHMPSRQLPIMLGAAFHGSLIWIKRPGPRSGGRNESESCLGYDWNTGLHGHSDPDRGINARTPIQASMPSPTNGNARM